MLEGYSKLNQDQVKIWVDALLSGKYQQGQGRLASSLNITPRYCCLGVACYVLAPDTPPTISKDGNAAWLDDNGLTQGFTLPDFLVRRLVLESYVDNREDKNLLIPPIRVQGTRYLSLASLNDAGVPFAHIAAIIQWVYSDGQQPDFLSPLEANEFAYTANM